MPFETESLGAWANIPILFFYELARSRLQGLRVQGQSARCFDIGRSSLRAPLPTTFCDEFGHLGRDGGRVEPLKQLHVNHGRSPHFEGVTDDVFALDNPLVRLLAFYLPQFHPIPENDEWWGKGFTEWTNVTRALPRYVGHYQPRLPADLGFYDLRNVETLRQQALLAKRYGVSGFCFHWYWFGGKRLLDTPLQTLLKHRDIDLPFFVNWANENWTRRWDGQEKSILLAQNYSAADNYAVADALLELTRDPRYLRVDGRPLVMLYRPSVAPDARAIILRWRERFAARGEANPYIMMAHAFDDLDPRPYGIDAAVQYPPHNSGDATKPLNHRHQLYDSAFAGNIGSYEGLAERMVDMEAPDFDFYRGVCPDWDNEARRPNAGGSFAGSTPRRYGKWLAKACRIALQQEEQSRRMVFINAWNEWAEGAYLEPDRHFGHAYLRETARVVNALREPQALDRFIAEREAEASPLVDRPSGPRDLLVRAVRKVARKLTAVGPDS